MHLVSCMAGGAEQCSGTGEELGDRCESEHVHLGVSALKQVHISAASLPLYLPAYACADTWSCKMQWHIYRFHLKAMLFDMASVI